MITPQSYNEVLSRSQKIVADKIRTYLKDPNEEIVHDLRTSIRRLLATFDLMPKKIRKQSESKKYLESYERLLKINAKVRDTDIVLSKLPNHGDDPAYSKLAKRLGNARDSKLKSAQKLASAVKDTKILALRTNDLSASALQKRFKKTTRTLAKKLRKRLRIVSRDAKNLDELHKLREDSRRLRFTLEVDDNPETSKLLPVVEAWQDVLGKIRDSDIFISHFKNDKETSRISQVLDREKSERKENFERFLEIAKESPMLSKNN